MKILILGATGMLGNTMFRLLSQDAANQVYGTLRSASSVRFFPSDQTSRLMPGIEVENHDAVVRVFAQVRPHVVINCVGLVKQLAQSKDPLQAVPINTLLPHRLLALCMASGSRLVHISTDCVFSGTQGGYKEEDFADADDLYGRSKLLGEIMEPPGITLRTSILGHELEGNRSLLSWFLSQPGPVRGFQRAIFSGLPTVELARVVREFVLPRPDLHGLYHVAAEPISKYKLLRLVAEVYDKKVEIQPEDQFVIDRSLNADRFRKATGYIAPDWHELIRRMHSFQ